MNQNFLPDGMRTTNDEPDAAEWETFRRARGAGEPLPHLGTWQYHYQPPGPTRIRQCQISETEIQCWLEDGRCITVPLAWFPILRDAAPDERAAFDIMPEGDLIHFPLLSTEVTTSQLLAFHDPLNEPDHLLSCASPARLLDDAAALVVKAIRLQGIEHAETVLRDLEARVRAQRW